MPNSIASVVSAEANPLTASASGAVPQDDNSSWAAAASEVARESQANTAGQIRNNAQNSVGVNPDNEAQVQHLARFMNVPLETARAQPDVLKGQLAGQEIQADTIAKQFPATSRVLSDPDKSKIAMDDVVNMKNLENGIPQQHGYVYDMFTGVGSTLLKLNGALDRASVYLNKHTVQLDSDETIAAMKNEAVIDQTAATESAPQHFTGQITSGLTYAPFGAAAPLIVAGAEGDASRQEFINQGVDPDTATKAGYTTGLVQGAAQMIPMGNLVVGSGGKEFVKSLAKTAGKSFLVGGGQSVVGDEATSQILAQNGYMDQAKENAPTFSKAIESGFFMSGLHLGMQGIHVASHPTPVQRATNLTTDQVARADQSEQDSTALQNVMTAAAQSKLRARDPDTFRQFMQQATEDGPAENIYIDPRSLAQSGVTLDQLAAAVPDSAESMHYASQIGSDIKIPTADFATNIAGTDIGEKLMDHIKTDPNGMSRLEAKDFRDNQGEYFKGEMEKILADQTGDDTFKLSSDNVEKNLHEQLTKTGRYTDDVVKPNAALMSAVYSVQAAKMGMTPEQLFQQIPIKIQAGEPRATDAERQQALEIRNSKPYLREGVNESLDFLRSGTRLPKPQGSDTPIMDHLRKQGGISRDSTAGKELVSMGLSPKSKLLKNDGRRGELDDVDAYSLKSAFKSDDVHVPEEENGATNERWLYDALHDEINGRPLGKLHDPRAAHLDDLKETLDRAGVDLNSMSNKEAIEAMREHDGGRDYSDEGNGDEYFQDQRGAFDPNTNTISLLKAADLSTFLHEGGHFYLEMMNKLALSDNAPAELKADMSTALKWMGVDGDGQAAIDKWNSMTLDDKRAMHEKFARGFEAYLFEGKSPNLKMSGVFQRFRGWLLNIYKSIGNLGVELTPDIRGVFDRMLATNEQITEAEHARGFAPMFKDAAAANMTPEEWKAYQDLGLQATMDAVTKLESRTMRDMQWLSNARAGELKRLQRENNTKRAAIKTEVTADVMNEPVNRARTFLRFGKLEGEEIDGPHRLDIQAMKDMYGDTPEAAWRQLENKYGKTGVLGKDGLDPEVAAEMFGYNSADEMVKDLLHAAKAKDSIAAQTDQRMLERYGDITDPVRMQKAADGAIHNKARTKFIATEMNALERAVGSKKTLNDAVKEYSQEIINRQKIRNVKPNQYSSAEVRAGKAADAARVKGDIKLAAVEKRNQLINNHATRAAMDALDAVDKGINYLKKFERKSTRKAIGAEYAQQIDAMLERFDLRKSTTATDVARRESLMQWVESQRALGLEPAIDERLLDEAQRMAYKDMSVEAFNGLIDSVKSVENIGRRTKKLLDNKDLRLFTDIVKEAVDGMKELPQRKQSDKINEFTGGKGLDKINAKYLTLKSTLRSADASLLKMEQLMDWLDRRNPNGVFNRIVFKRIAEAGGRQEEMQRVIAKELKTHNQATSDEFKKDLLNRYTAPELLNKETGQPHTFLKSELLAMAANTANDSNLSKMARGHGWKVEDIRTVLNRHLTKEDIDYVNNMVTMANKLWPEKVAMYKRLGGEIPEKITGKDFALKNGDIKGGYYPVVYDPLKTKDMPGKPGGEAMFDPQYRRATTDTGRMNERNERFAAPLDLRLGVLPRVLIQEIHDITHREAIIDADRFLSDKRVRGGIERAMGREYYSQLRPWLQAIANDKVYDSRGLAFWDKAAHWARTSATMVGLGFRLSTMLVHGATAGSNSVGEIGGKWMLSGVRSFYGSPEKMADARDFVFSRSLEMKNRMDSIDRDVRDGLRELEMQAESKPLGKLKGGLNTTRRFAYYGISMLDMASAMPTWMGAYNKHMSEGMSEDAAIYAADKAVRNAHGGGSIKDSAAIQRGSEFQKLFTMFYSFWNHFYNRQRDIARSAAQLPETIRSGDYAKAKDDFTRILSRSLFYFIVPSLIHGAIKDSKDDDQDWLSWAAEEVATGLFSGIPVVRDVANSAANHRDYQATPAAGIITSMAKSAKDIEGIFSGEGPSDKFVKNTVTNAGYAFGLPTGQAATTTQFLWDVMDGDQAPHSMGDWYKGVTTGKTD